MREIALFICATIGIVSCAMFAIANFVANDPQPILLLSVSCAAAFVLCSELSRRSSERKRVARKRRRERKIRTRIPQTTKPFAQRLNSFATRKPVGSSESERTESKMPYWCRVDLTSGATTPAKSAAFIRSVLQRIRAILNRTSPPFQGSD